MMSVETPPPSKPPPEMLEDRDAARQRRRSLRERLEHAWVAPPGSHGAERWTVRMMRTKRWSFWAGMGLLVVFVLVPTVVLLPLGEAEPSAAVEWFLYTWTLILGALLAVGLLLSRRVHPFDLGFTGRRCLPPRLHDKEAYPRGERRTLGRDVRFTVLFALLLACFYAALGFVLWLLWPGYVDWVLSEKVWAVVVVVSMVVAAPIGEEILFRGVLYPIFRREYGPFVGALLNALVFALMHVSFSGAVSPANLNHFLGGLIFCYAYERTGSLWPAMALHLLGNSSLVLLHHAPLEGVSEVLHTLFG